MAVDSNSIAMTWSAPDVPYGIITSYTITYNITTENFTSLVTDSQNIILEGLDEYTIYMINVSASTKVGTGPSAQFFQRTGQSSELSEEKDISLLLPSPFSFCLHIFMPCVDPHSSPISIEVPSTQSKSATITWQPPVPEDRNGIITYYLLVVYNLEFNVNNITVNISGSVLSYTVDQLEEFSRHGCRIAAGTIVGPGPYSSSTEFVTLQDGKHIHVISSSKII